MTRMANPNSMIYDDNFDRKQPYYKNKTTRMLTGNSQIEKKKKKKKKKTKN